MNIGKFASKAYLLAQAKSPEILLVVGLGVGAVALYKAVQYGQEIERKKIIENYRKDIEWADSGEAGETFEVDRFKRDVAVETAKELAVKAVPMLATGLISAACIAASFKILNGRYAVAATALTSVTEAYARYREATGQGLIPSYPGAVLTADGSGAVVDQQSVNSELETALEEAGLGPRKLNKHGTGFGFVWDKFSCHYRQNDPASNSFHIQAVEKHLNQLLIARGHVFLNELFDQFDVERTPEGQLVGWVRDDKHPDTHIVLFPLYVQSAASSDEVIIESNPMGVVYKLI